MKKWVSLVILILFTSSAFPVLLNDIQIKKLDAGRLKYFPYRQITKIISFFSLLIMKHR